MPRNSVEGECRGDNVVYYCILVFRMTHRGACSADNDSGDGAGALIGIPHQFYKAELAEAGVNLPDQGQYATGIVFMDQDTASYSRYLY